nr:hypothetical protein C02A12.7 - Caenorhabditis elegans [Caenorhabditis elegans]
MVITSRETKVHSITLLPSVVNMLFRNHLKVRFDHARGLYRTKHDDQIPPKIVLPKRPIIDCQQFYQSSEDIDEEQVPSTSNAASTSKSAGK